MDNSHAAVDLDSPEEIAEMVRSFYADVAQDDLLGPIFNDVAQVDWSEHLPKLTAFWSRALLHIPGYSGNPYAKHIETHAKQPLTTEDFERWLMLFEDTIDARWAGPKAEHAKAFARHVATVHSRRIVGETIELTEPGPMSR